MKVDRARPSGDASSTALQEADRKPQADPKPIPAEDDAPSPAADFDIASDLHLLSRALRPVKGARLLMAIFGATALVSIFIMAGQVRLNKWNGQFFDAISRRDGPGFVHYIIVFMPLVAALLALTVAHTFLQERLKFRLREWVSRHLLDEWLKPMRIYHLTFVGDDGRNPDQRIQEDTRLLGDSTCDLACGAVNSLLQVTAFVGVLWALSTQVSFTIGSHNIAIRATWCGARCSMP